MEIELLRAISVISSLVAIVPWIILVVRIKDGKKSITDRADQEVATAIEVLFKGLSLISIVHAVLTLAVMWGLDGDGLSLVSNIKNIILNVGLGTLGAAFYLIYKKG